MTKLVRGANPEELQEKLDQLLGDDTEDRPWWLHGEVVREDGLFYQWLTDENPNPRVTLVFDPTNIEAIGKVIQRFEAVSATPAVRGRR